MCVCVCFKESVFLSVMWGSLFVKVVGNKNFEAYGENLLCSFVTPFSLILLTYGLDCITRLLEDCL